MFRSNFFGLNRDNVVSEINYYLMGLEKYLRIKTIIC